MITWTNFYLPISLLGCGQCGYPSVVMQLPLILQVTNTRYKNFFHYFTLFWTLVYQLMLQYKDFSLGGRVFSSLRTLLTYWNDGISTSGKMVDYGMAPSRKVLYVVAMHDCLKLYGNKRTLYLSKSIGIANANNPILNIRWNESGLSFLGNYIWQ